MSKELTLIDDAPVEASIRRDAAKFRKLLVRLKVRETWTQCPECGGAIYFGVVGPHDHVRLWCLGACKREWIE